jgi:glycosyltransferase involved in cell wall biosynthesis
MKFAIMARIIDYYGSGVHTNLLGLLNGISQIRTPHEFILLVDPSQSLPNELSNNRFLPVSIPPLTRNNLGKLIWDHLSVGTACKKLGVDALYAPAHVRPSYMPIPVVVQVLDMMYHLFPDNWKWSDQLYFRIAVSTLTARATYISALSESTKRDILSLTSTPEDLIKVIYPGTPAGFRPLESAVSTFIRERYLLWNPFILFIGSFHPRKNLKGLVRAYEEVADKLPHDLVIIVSTRWSDHRLEDNIRNSKFAQRIHLFKGVVPRNDLPLFYNEADLFVFPSYYEGFGFPVLEALACGCPTITTNVSSLPEVSGDAAILVSPGDTSALSNAIFNLATDSDLRSDIGKKGVRLAHGFSWSTTAQKTIDLLEEAALSRN